MTAPPLPAPPAESRTTSSAGLLARLAEVSVRRRRAVVALWLVLLVAVGVGGTTASGEFTADYRATGSDSAAAQTLLEQRFAEQAGIEVDVVVRAAAGVTDGAALAATSGLLVDAAGLDAVLSTSPPDAPFTRVSADGRTGVAEVRFAGQVEDDVPVEQVEALVAAAEGASTDEVQLELAGDVVQLALEAEAGGEALGVAAAAVVLVVTFGALVAAGLPLGVALAGILVSTGLIGLLTRVLDVPEWATSMATIIGIGVGIDYVLLMVSRYRESLEQGHEPADAVVRTVQTAGRAVLVAGTTVVIALLGLATMGLSYMTGAAVATMVAVAVVMLSAVTLLPALLGFVGRRVDRGRMPGLRPGRADAPSWRRWSRAVQARPVVAAVVGFGLLVGLSAPALGLRLGFPDASSTPAGSTTNDAHALLVDGFGEGSTAPLVVAVDLAEVSDPAVPAVLGDVAAAAASTAGVAAVVDPQVAPGGDAAVVVVVPEGGPTSEATEGLVGDLRDDVLPAALAGSGATASVGGATAAALDQTADVSSRLPFLVAGVVLLATLLLVAVFRSVIVAVKAALLNLVSISAAVGVVAYALQGGWFGQLLGIDAPTPLPAFIPVIMFAVLFGLSMDYEVFLLSRVRESWVQRRGGQLPAEQADRAAAEAVTDGLARTGRVITAAAAIMVVVFAGLASSPDVILKTIGIGLAAAVLVDATVVRVLLVPALMQLLGRRAWSMPGWLDRVVPHVSVDGPVDDDADALAAPAHEGREEREPVLV